MSKQTNLVPVTLVSPKGADAACALIAEKLSDEFSWLTAYGRSQDWFSDPDDNRSKQPGIYCGRGEYLSMLPDEHLGCFSFFRVMPVKKIEQWIDFADPITVFDFSLIVWYDLRKIYPTTYDQYSTENVNQLLLEFLVDLSIPFTLSVSEIVEGFELVYKDYDRALYDRTSFMMPQHGVRFSGRIEYPLTNC